MLLLALQAGGPAVAAALRYERAAIAGGELWRLLSGHFVHLGWAHCLLNAGGLLALAAILPAPLRGRCCLLLGGAIGIALFATLPDLQRYAGFSGINYGTATLALLPRCRGEAVAACCWQRWWPGRGNGWPTAARPMPRGWARRRWPRPISPDWPAAPCWRWPDRSGARRYADRPCSTALPRQASAPATEPAAWDGGADTPRVSMPASCRAPSV